MAFETRARDIAALARKVEGQLNANFGFEIHALIRTAEALRMIAAHPAFELADLAHAATFVVGFVGEPLSAQAAARVLDFRNDLDDFHVHGRDIYWLSRMRQSESPFSNAALGRALGTCATFRAMRTVQRLLAKHFVKGPPA